MIRRVGVVGLALVLVAGARAGFDDALSDFKAGKYLEAAAEFQAMVDAAPGYDYGHAMLGRCYLAMSRPGDARRSFETAIALRGDRPEYYHGLAVALAEEKRYGQAYDALVAGERLATGPAEQFAFLSLRGYVLGGLGRWEEAAASLERAIGIREDKAILDELALAWFEIGRYDGAASACRESLKLDPEDARVHALLAESLVRLASTAEDLPRKRGYYAQAVAVAQRLLELRPADRQATLLLGRAALGAASYDVAERALRAFVTGPPGSCGAFVDLSRVYVAKRRWEEAERAARDAASCAPTSAAAHEGLGFVLFQLGRFRESLEAYRRADALQPSDTTREGIAAAASRLAPPGTGPER